MSDHHNTYSNLKGINERLAALKLRPLVASEVALLDPASRQQLFRALDEADRKQEAYDYLDRLLVNFTLHGLGLRARVSTENLKVLGAKRTRFDEALAQAASNASARGYLERELHAIKAQGAEDTTLPRAPGPGMPPPASNSAAPASTPAPIAPATPPRAIPQAPDTAALPRGGMGSPVPVMNGVTRPESARAAPPGETTAAAQPTSPPTTAPTAPKRRESFHVYGGKAAITLEPNATPGGEPTVFVDIAPSTGPKAYNWSKKIRWMFTPAELYALLAVLIGALPSARFGNHGEDAKKWMELEHQGEKIFLKLGDGTAMHALPIYAPDAMKISALVIRQIRAALTGLTDSALLALVRGQFAPMHQAQAAKKPPARAANG